MWYNLNLKKIVAGVGEGVTALMTQSRQSGYNFAKLGPAAKKICVRLFFVLMLNIKFQVPSSRGSSFTTNKRRNGQTDRPKAICYLNFFKVGGI